MRLRLQSGAEAGTSVSVPEGRFVLGRDDDCDLVLFDKTVSGRHAAITVDADDHAVVTDLGSLNGTFVDGRRITTATPLVGGEALRFGETVVVVSSGSPLESTPSTPEPRSPGESTIQRLVSDLLGKERHRQRRVTWAALGLGALGAAVAVLLAVGIFGGEDAPPTTQEIVQTVRPSVVDVMLDDDDVGSGTGWVLDAREGLVVTNAHVVEGGSRFSVLSGSSRRSASLVGVAPCEDLAVLKVEDTSGLEALPLGDQGSVNEGEQVVALGFPANLQNREDLTATTGVISVARTSVGGGGSFPHYANVVQTDAAINPGNSGGPLVDLDAHLVGVNTFVSTENQNQNYAIGVDRVRKITNTLRQGRSLGWTGAWMGFEDDSWYQDKDAPISMLYTGVVPGTSAASVLGEEFANDTVLLVQAVDGARLDNNLPTYCNAVGDRTKGDRAKFSIGAEVELDFE